MPADEMFRVNAEDTAARVEQAKATGRPFKPGNKAASGRRPKLARLGIQRETIDAKDPKYGSYLRQAEGYRRARIQEYKKTHGFLSVGAMALIATASLQLAASRYLMEKAINEGDMEMLKKASGLANDARQNELASWELASREGSAKAKASANHAPWEVPAVGKVRVEDALPEELNPFVAEAIDEPKKAAQVPLAAPVVAEGKSHGEDKP